MEHRRPPKRTRQPLVGPTNSESSDLQRNVPLTTEADKTYHNEHDSMGPVSHQARTSHVQLAKLSAIEQALKEGCTGSFKSFDSQFGNFLVPVIPTLNDLKL